MPQLSRPDADVANDGWSPTPLFERLNAEEPDDGVYVVSPCVPPSRSFVVHLAPVAGPLVAGTTLTVRLAGSRCAAAVVTLLDVLGGEDVFVAADEFALTGEFSDYVLTLTADQAARAEDPTTLKVLVTAVADASDSSCGSHSCGGSASDDKVVTPCGTVSRMLWVTVGTLEFLIEYSGGQWYGYTGPTMDCVNGVGVTLGCYDGAWHIGGIASYRGPDGAVVSPSSLSPFDLAYTGPQSAFCGGNITLTVTEVPVTEV